MKRNMDLNSIVSEELHSYIEQLGEISSRFVEVYNKLDKFFKEKVDNGRIKNEDRVEYGKLQDEFHEVWEELKGVMSKLD